MESKDKSFLKVLGSYDDQKSANRAVLNLLLDQGMEKGEVFEVYNFFYFRKKTDAELAAEELADIGFVIDTIHKHDDRETDNLDDFLIEGEYEKPPETERLPWEVICTIQLAMNEERLDKLTDFLNELAARYHGKYDGWEVEVKPDDPENFGR